MAGLTRFTNLARGRLGIRSVHLWFDDTLRDPDRLRCHFQLVFTGLRSPVHLSALGSILHASIRTPCPRTLVPRGLGFLPMMRPC